MLLSQRDYLKLAEDALRRDIGPALDDERLIGLTTLVADALAELRKRDQVLPDLRSHLKPAARDLLKQLQAISGVPSRNAIASLLAALEADTVDASMWRDLFDLFDKAAQFLMGQTGAEGETGRAAEQWLRDVAEWELAWYEGFANAEIPTADISDKQFQSLTPDILAAHLGERLDDAGGVTVTDFTSIPGGSTNETYFFTLNQEGELPRELVVRKNAAWPFFKHWAHSVAVESRILGIISDEGLPVPKPLWVFTDLPDVAGNFYIMTRGQGHMVGSLAGADGQLPKKLLFSLAEFLAELHAIPAERFATLLEEGLLPTQPTDSVEDAVRRNVQSMRSVWESGPRFPSPGEAFSIDWLLRNVPANTRPPSIVHTDCFVHNFLVDDDLIETVVDWEASHLGDPAEDLAYIKDQVSLHMEWGRFIDHYRACGGAEIDESSLDYYKCLLNFRNYFGSNIGAARIPQGYDDIRMLPLGSQFYTAFMRSTIEGTRATDQENESG